MPNLIQIKRSTTTATPSGLANGELAYSFSSNSLFIGDQNNAGASLRIGGGEFVYVYGVTPGALTASKALIANSTSGINRIFTSNLTLGAASVSTVNTIANSTVLGAASNSELTSTWAIKAYVDAQVGQAGATQLDQLSDVTLASVANNHMMVYNSVSGQWENHPVTNGLTHTSHDLGILVGNNQLVANSTGLWVNQANINHNLLNNYVADQHVAHTGVTLTAGSGLTGGGDISASRTFNVGAGNGITVNTDDVAVNAQSGLLANTTGLWVRTGNTQLTANATGLWVVQTNIDHNLLANYSGNQHIDHTTVSITAGSGLTGGGNISASRTVDVGAGVGITVNADDVAVNAQSGLLANTTGLWVRANNGIIANATGVYVNAGVGLTVDATSLRVLAGTGVVANATGVHIGQAVAATDSPTFNNLTLSGNLVVNGTTMTINSTNISVDDGMIKMGDGNAADSLDLGFYAQYTSTGTRYAGLFRDATDGKFRLFANSTVEPNTSVVDTGAAGYVTGILVTALESSSATITGGSITGITDLAVADGGTGVSSFTQNGVFYGGTTTSLAFATGTDGQVLQMNGSGVPVFAGLDGGTF